MSKSLVVTLIFEDNTQEFTQRTITEAKRHFSNTSSKLKFENTLSLESPYCVEFYIDTPSYQKVEFGLKNLQEQGVEIFLLEDTVYRRYKKMFVFDMDSTLIKQEVIDELGKFKGIKSQIEEITNQAMEGKLDFQESLKQRVMLLKGTHKSFLNETAKKLEYSEGVLELFKALKKLGIKTAVVSGGFDYFTNHIKQHLGIDYSMANELVFNEKGTTTGEVGDIIVDEDLKAKIVDILAKQNNIQKEQIVCIGDGANDIKMLNTACTLGIAYKAKRLVREKTRHQLNCSNMTYVLYLLGLSKQEIKTLTE